LRWTMALTLAVVTGIILAASAAGAGTGRDFEGTWEPPPAASVNTYKITTTVGGSDGTTYEGRLTAGTLATCSGSPSQGQIFWFGNQDGSLGGEPTYEGRTFIFRTDNNGENCEARLVRARFWSPANDRMRICPNSFDNPHAEPSLVTQSPVDQSATCTDFRRTSTPPSANPGTHTAKQYVPKITRDSNTCPKYGPVDYNVYLRFIADDPMVSVKIYLKRTKHGTFKRYPNNQFFLPTERFNPRDLDFPWVKKGPLWVKVKFVTKSGKKYTRKVKYFKPCHA
jgi:hypothetical protein